MKTILIVVLDIVGSVLGGIWDGVRAFWEPHSAAKYTAHFEDVKSFFSAKSLGVSVNGLLHADNEQIL